MTIRNRLIKHASAGQVIGNVVKQIPGKVLYPTIGIGSIAAYEKGKEGVRDLKSGRSNRKAREEQAKEMMRRARMAKYAEAPTLFSREPGQIFPLASESGAISWRQSYLDGLLAHKNEMGRMAHEQLKDLFPVADGLTKGKNGHRQRSMTSGKDAGSALVKAFKSK